MVSKYWLKVIFVWQRCYNFYSIWKLGGASKLFCRFSVAPLEVCLLPSIAGIIVIWVVLHDGLKEVLYNVWIQVFGYLQTGWTVEAMGGIRDEPTIPGSQGFQPHSVFGGLCISGGMRRGRQGRGAAPGAVGGWCEHSQRRRPDSSPPGNSLPLVFPSPYLSKYFGTFWLTFTHKMADIKVTKVRNSFKLKVAHYTHCLYLYNFIRYCTITCLLWLWVKCREHIAHFSPLGESQGRFFHKVLFIFNNDMLN